MLGSILAGPAVQGIQSQGVIANAKHYVDNNQETERFDITEIVDERTNFEVYYRPFKAAVDAGLLSVMCSYNKILTSGQASGPGPGPEGLYSCENPLTLQRDLKERMNFSGFVMSDYGGVHSQSLNAGLDQEMPGFAFLNATGLNASINAGALTRSRVDNAATRILTALFSVGLFDKPNPNTPLKSASSAAHHAAAAEIAAAGTVLLQNRGGLLPLHPARLRAAADSDGADHPTIAVIGHEALGTDRNGKVVTTTAGGGSGHVNGAQLTGPLAGITARCGTGCKIAHADVLSDHDIPAAVTLAKSATVVLVFVATSSAEGTDRFNLSLTNPCQSTVSGACSNPLPGLDQDKLVAAVSEAAGAKTVVVAVTPGALLTPWAKDAAAVLIPFMPGQNYGTAIAAIIFGDVSPAGKLPVTFPTEEHQQRFPVTAFPGLTNGTTPIPISCNFNCPKGAGAANYSERLLVGYKWFESLGLTPAFCFGHGLGYSKFDFSNIKLDTETKLSSTMINFTLTNAGAVAAAEVAQLYVSFPPAAGEPARQLKGARKVLLPAGGVADVSFVLTADDMSVWDVEHEPHGWNAIAGEFNLSIGPSSCDIRLNATLKA
eukprot:SAG22_NODE_340_length_12031_cov_9.961783_4_plen_603_part_00